MLELLHSVPFYELTAALFLAALGGFVGLLLRQPMIVSFIAVGVLAGPSALGLIQASEHIDLLAELGVAVLLFLVGLKLDLKLIRTMGAVSLATGLGQVVFTALIGFVLGLMLGLDSLTAIYVAVALTFSSTIIIVKLLSDKKEVDSLHGRIALGFLIVQDLVVVLAMMALSAFGMNDQEQEGDSGRILGTVLYGLVMFALIGVFMRFGARPLMQRLARSREMLVTFAIAWAALLAALGDYLGFSKELGGLLAGVSLASTPFREAILSRMASVRDFLLLFFFIALGTQLDLGLLGDQVVPALVFSIFILLGNPLIVMVIMGFMGFRKRTGFLAGLTVAQISEFSLIFMAMGLSLGHVTQESLGLVTLVGLITIALSVYMITYSHELYRWVEPVLGGFERIRPYREQAMDQARREQVGALDVILFGFGRYGRALADELREAGYTILVVDFDPDTVRQARRQGYNAIYGDASDEEFFDSLPLIGVKWVISSLPQHETGLTHEDPRFILLQALKQRRFQGAVAVSTPYSTEVEVLRAAGADKVFLPFHGAARQAVLSLQEMQ